ncbi:MAG: hypothetical protein EHM28_01305 [Spirochaetaceae bacterium]|nr:MAG: hypothetical protein EHM28_01305 [Spirochaetaceae bacterium]
MIDKKILLKNRYRTIRSPGHGGQAETFLAEDTETGKIVVCKETSRCQNWKLRPPPVSELMWQTERPLCFCPQQRLQARSCSNSASLCLSGPLSGHASIFPLCSRQKRNSA